MAQPNTPIKFGYQDPGQPFLNRVYMDYSFARDGGLVSSITLSGDTVPSGAVVVNALLQVDTILASGGGATAALRLEGANDILTATAFGSSPWSTTGAKRVTLTATTTPVTTTADRALLLVVATAALTAGVFRVVLEYFLPDTAPVA